MPVARTSCAGWSTTSRPSRVTCTVHVPPVSVEGRRRRLAVAPVVELHDLRVALEPVAHLVLGREDGPVVGEGQVGHVVVPDRVVQAERVVAAAPLVAGSWVLVDDERRHAETLEPRGEADAALAAADDEDVGLGVDAEGLDLLLPLVEPVLRRDVDAVLGAAGTARTGRLGVVLERLRARQQGPGQAVADADEALAREGGVAEGEPRLVDAVGLGLARRHDVGGPRPGSTPAEHVGDLLTALGRVDVPRHADEVAPVALVAEETGHPVDLAGGQRVPEPPEPLARRQLLTHRQLLCPRGGVVVLTLGAGEVARQGCRTLQVAPAGVCRVLRSRRAAPSRAW